MLGLKKSPTILRISIKLSAILVTDYDQFESGSERENKVFEIDNELSKWSFGSVAEMLFDKRFGCLEEEINKEAQTFIKAVGDFLANAVEVGFLPSWFYKIYVNQKRIKFFENFDTMYD